MSTRERREEEIQAMRANILGTARALARESGWSAVSLRNIGKRIRYSAPVVYGYFKNKEAILRELRREGFAQLHDTFAGIQARETDPTAAVVAVSRAHYAFALQHPELYQVMFNLEGVTCEGTCPAGDTAIRSARQTLMTLFAPFATDETPADELFFHWWATVHGYVTLQINPRFRGEPGRMPTLLERAVRRFLASLHIAQDA